MEHPSITAQKLLDALFEEGLLDESALVSLLGEERHGVSLNKLEMTLIKAGTVSQERLLALKGAVAGRPIYDGTDRVVVPALPAELAKLTGALPLSGEPKAVAFVEDLSTNIEAVGRALGTTDFAVHLITASQFVTLFKQAYALETAKTANAYSSIYEIFDEAVRRRATDIHIAVGAPPSLRIDGEILKVDMAPIGEGWLLQQLQRVASDRAWAEFQEQLQADFAISHGGSRFRVNIYRDRFGPAAAFRKISTSLPTADDLGLPQAVRNFGRLDRGIVLVTGPTGSGKSTTLAALLNDMTRTQARHILTLEDPVEYFLPTDLRSVVNQRELGVHFTTFPNALKAALRQDPDVILVGEMRDNETIRVALTAAETGHLVFGTMHTYDAASTVARIVNSFPADEQEQIRAVLAFVLKGVVSQTLLPKAKTNGRVAAMEVLVVNHAIANNLRKVDGFNAIKQTMETSSREGMSTLDSSLADLVRRGVIKESDAEYKARNLEDFQRLLKVRREDD